MHSIHVRRSDEQHMHFAYLQKTDPRVKCRLLCKTSLTFSLHGLPTLNWRVILASPIRRFRRGSSEDQSLPLIGGTSRAPPRHVGFRKLPRTCLLAFTLARQMKVPRVSRKSWQAIT